MAVITASNIPNPVIDEYCIKFGYQATINGSPNPQTKPEFVRAGMINHVRVNAREQRVNTAAAATAATTGTDFDNTVVIT